MKKEDFKKIISSVQMPGRYTGGEYNSYERGDETYSFLLCYPDDYRIGMSSLGYHTVGKIVSGQQGFSVERCFAPAPDMEEKMRSKNIELFSLETQTPASEFDIIGFSVHHELSFTNLINMLQMAGLQPRRKNRLPSDSLVIAGGPATVNPSILGEFTDLLVVGEGEAVIPPLLDLFGRTSSKETFLSRAAEIEGVFVPGRSKSVNITPYREFSDRYVPYDNPVPGVSVPHDRINIEISRGCRGSCRFCQASVIYSPYRQKPKERILESASKSVASSGCDEIALTALSATDHGEILHIMDDIHYAFRGLGISLVMPSLRPEDFRGGFARRLSRMRRGSLTFAPETPSRRLKKIINKNIENDKILHAVRRAAERGWRKIKLYFMIGLPGETMDDIDEIAVFVQKIKSETEIKNVTVSLSAFTPQPHTPLQWVVPGKPEILKEKERRIRKSVRGAVKGINIQSHIISSILCRGDRKLAGLVYEAFRQGARLDQWGEHFNYGAWKKAFKKFGLDIIECYLKEFGIDENLPWDGVQTVAGKEYMVKSYRSVLKMTGGKAGV